MLLPLLKSFKSRMRVTLRHPDVYSVFTSRFCTSNFAGESYLTRLSARLSKAEVTKYRDGSLDLGQRFALLLCTRSRHIGIVKIYQSLTRTMGGSRCIVSGCSNKTSPTVSLHLFPSDVRVRSAWIRAVKLTRKGWAGPSKHSVICSDHFAADCFEEPATSSTALQLMGECGIVYRKRRTGGGCHTFPFFGHKSKEEPKEKVDTGHHQARAGRLGQGGGVALVCCNARPRGLANPKVLVRLP